VARNRFQIRVGLIILLSSVVLLPLSYNLRKGKVIKKIKKKVHDKTKLVTQALLFRSLPLFSVFTCRVKEILKEKGGKKEEKKKAKDI
jgi:hypothetical protein